MVDSSLMDFSVAGVLRMTIFGSFSSLAFEVTLRGMARYVFLFFDGPGAGNESGTGVGTDTGTGAKVGVGAVVDVGGKQGSIGA